MTTVRTFFILGIFCALSSVAIFGAVSSVSITQSGSASGNCTSNVQTPAFFNNSANWGSGASQIGPGTVVLFCGTFTGTAGQAGFTFQGSGSSTSPVTLKFDTGAVMTAPYWGGATTGAINCTGQSYVTVDGGTNGTIQNSANGTALGNHQSSYGLFFNSCPDAEIENLTIRNIYINQGGASTSTDVGGQNTGDISLQGKSTNTKIHNNVLSNSRTGIWISFDSGGDASGIQLYNNTINDHPWSINIGADNTNSTASGVSIHDNVISDWSNWQFPIATYHTDGIIVYNDVTTAPIGTYSIYNNTFTGTLGNGSPTGYIACGETSACTIFNNVMVDTGSYACYGYIWLYISGGPDYVNNNTLIGSSTTSGSSVAVTLDGSPVTVKNNIFLNVAIGLHDYATLNLDVVASDHNLWLTTGGGAPQVATNDSKWITYSAWQALGFDANSVTSNPLLSSTYVPQAGSPVIGRGANMTTMGISALDADKVGTPRAGTGNCTPGIAGCWDAGAYAYSSASTPPPPPIGVSATSK